MPLFIPLQDKTRSKLHDSGSTGTGSSEGKPAILQSERPTHTAERTPEGGYNVAMIALFSNPFPGVATRLVQLPGKLGRMLFKVYLRRAELFTGAAGKI